MSRQRLSLSLWSTLIISTLLSPFSSAETPAFTLRIKDHLFDPSRLVVPANVKFKLIIDNQDPTPEEFESFELNREKVIIGGQRGTVFIGPLRPGEYPFFGEFNPKSAQGVIVAE